MLREQENGSGVEPRGINGNEWNTKEFFWVRWVLAF